MKKTLTMTNKPRRTPTVGAQSIHHIPSPEAIAVAAYYRAEQRGFEPGGELSDWLEAERELSEEILQE